MNEATVRYVHFEDYGMGNKPALLIRGRKHTHCVINDDTGVRVLRIPVKDGDRGRPIPYRGGEYPVDRFRSEMLRIGDRKGITQKASVILLGAESGDLDADPEPSTAVATAPLPLKPASKPPAGSGCGLIGSLSTEFGLDPAVIRRRLRAGGLSAPYIDPDAARRVLA